MLSSFQQLHVLESLSVIVPLSPCGHEVTTAFQEQWREAEKPSTPRLQVRRLLQDITQPDVAAPSYLPLGTAGLTSGSTLSSQVMRGNSGCAPRCGRPHFLFALRKSHSVSSSPAGRERAGLPSHQPPSRWAAVSAPQAVVPLHTPPCHSATAESRKQLPMFNFTIPIRAGVFKDQKIKTLLFSASNCRWSRTGNG